MKINNRKIRTWIRLIATVLLITSIADLIMYSIEGSLSNYALGYLGLICVGLVALVYIFTGMPIFKYDAETEMVEISSKYALSNLFAKTSYINKKDITGFKVTEGFVRKKLEIYQTKNGKDLIEDYSITFLSARQVANLKNSLEGIAEANKTDSYKDILFI